VYTSSAGVVFDGGDVINLDERAPFPEKPFDAYNDSKAQGEKLILEANGKGGLLTVALRPAGIFGYVISLYQPMKINFDTTRCSSVRVTVK
jgi:sterol-4alpha-carboxylate 3-dehydrogenase (decarboxylating)